MARNPASSHLRGHHSTLTSARLEALSTSLGHRLLIPLLLLAATVLAIHAYSSFRSTREQFLGFAASEADRASGFIRRATHDGMLLNRLDEVQATIERLAQEPDIAAIRIHDNHGRIVLSSTPAEVGQHVALQADDAKVVRQLTALSKEQACIGSGCHDAGASSILGMLEVEMSMVPLKQALATTRRRLIWTTFGLLLVFGLSATLIVRTHHGWMRLSHRLEEKVVEKTAQLQAAERQVLHMEKMASLGKLSATVAHELNNPISGMLTYARLIERELDDQTLPDEVTAQLQSWLHLVQQECARCGEIVSNLLVFARRGSAEMRPTNVNDVVQRSLMLIHHRLDMNGIRASVRQLEHDPDIAADAGQLEQALVALLINAAEAMPRGGELRIELSGNPTAIGIAVSDTGTGMPPEVLQQIFEPFFSTKANESGAGLGLAIVYGIVHRHGGTIEVHSAVGAGTTFHMTFPRHPPDNDVAHELESGAAAKGVLV